MDDLDINTSNTQREICLADNMISFPERYLELYFADYLEDHGLTYEVHEERAYVAGNEELVDRLYAVQIATTHAQHWYPLLAEKPGLTFESVLIKLNEDNLQNLEQYALGLSTGIKSMDPKIDTLAQRIRTAGESLKCPYLFVRLNSVSPKPRRISHNRFNVESTGWEYRVLDLLMESSRTRHTLKNPLWEHYIMLRKFYPIEEWQEFRCFIYKNRLTAISQYHCYQRYKKLIGRTERIRKAIYNFYLENFAYIPYEDCVMDVIVDDDDHVQIVEFNSFGADGMAGSALYNWDRDEKILRGEFTMQNGPDIQILSSLSRETME